MTASYTNSVLVTATSAVGTTVGVHASAIIYQAGQTIARFGFGGSTSTPAGVYIDASVVNISSSLFGTTQFATVSTISTGEITFTTPVSTTQGDVITKVQNIPSNSSTPFTFPAKSQKEQLRKRALGY
jgi:hypothetical protein